MRKLSNNYRKVSCFVLLIFFLFGYVHVQSQSFSSSNLSGESLNNPTSLQFGPDGRLYVSQQDGTIFAYTIQKNAPNDYQVTNTETIQLVRQIPNHDDDGTLNPAETDRQVTGLLVTGTASNPILYVSSSDPRIGGGESGGIGDVNLDTNSGVISKLTWNGSSWTRVEVVKGLPRSEENHAVNGIQLDEATNTLYLAMGGSTNAGSPSANFAYSTEYALSAAVLMIDLDMIDNNFGGSYDLPTLDDPTRANTGPGGSDVGDPYGGNDGLNQAKIVIGGPVQVHAPGYRNSYDLVLTKTPGVEGRLYTIDNGANAGWGGYPENEGTANVTSNYVIGEPGSVGPGPPDPVNNLDNLHYVSGPGFGPIYGGHPNPIRANPAGAGLYRRDNSNQEVFELNPTTDWPPVPVSLANPVEGDFRNPGVDDGALWTWGSSTNGLAEYTATNFFGGAITGDLLAASFDGSIYRIELSANGQSTTNVQAFASGFGSVPLDVTAQGTGDIFEGTVWAVTYVTGNVTVFEPDQPPDDGWTVEASSNDPTARHENAYVEAGGLFYLIGGRGSKPLDIYDPVAQSWSTGAAPPLEMHHFQAVSYQGDVYVIGGFTGPFPNETPLTNVYVYDPGADSWTTGPSIPVGRRRGSTGAVVYNDKIYMVSGLQNGHVDGWVPWLDEFNPSTGTWTNLSDAPRARDHFQVGIIGDKLYAAGGRRTGQNTLFTPTISEVDVYDFITSTWSTLPGTANIPTERAGASTVVANGTVIVIGGETGSQTIAHNETEALDPATNTWITMDPLNTGRHATQAIIYNAKIYIAAGSGNRGGGPELTSQEFLNLGTNCTGDINNFNLDDDNDGYSNGDETLNGTDPCSAASRPPDNDGDFLSDLLDNDDDNDGLLDTVDAFALDAQNGEATSLPVNYPFLNGNPGFGLFGLGLTGLMTNQVSDYLDLFDATDPGLIMGGASGVATVPVSSGDATTNDQEYAFQFGVSVTSSTNIFNVKSKMQGAPFFNGVFQDQSQGIYIGNGDQDNYLKIVLAANGGNGAFQIFAENNGSIVQNTFFNVTDILLESEINLFLKIDPSAGTVQPQYSTGSNSAVIDLGTPIALSGTVLNTIQGPDALAIGIIATSGSAPSYQATWDFIEVQPDQVFQVQRINSGGPAFSFGGENWQADQFNNGNKTFENAIAIANTTNDVLYQTEVSSSTGGFTYDIPVTNGDYSVNIHFAEIFHGVENGNGVGARVFDVDIENGQEQLSNYDIIAQAGAPATAIIESFNNINVSDGSLTIVFTTITDRAKVSGIEVFGSSSTLPPVVINPGTQLLNPGEVVNLQINATDPNPSDVITYSATGLPASLTIDPVSGIISGTVTDPIGDYAVTVTATDDGGLFSEVNFSMAVNNFQVLFRINSGGPAFTFNGENWLVDQFNDGANQFENVIPIGATTNDVLYQTERFDNGGNFSYNIPVPVTGTYGVRLHFAEIFHGVNNSNGVGARIFNLDMEGGQGQLTNYDIIAASGGPATAITVAWSDIQVTDGVLTINFLASVDNPKLSGLEVFNIASPPSAPVVVQPGNQIYNDGEQVIIQINGTDPNLGDILTFTATGLPNSLTIDSGTGLISGTLADAAGDYSVTVRVTDNGGLFDEQTFNITIGNFTSLFRINSGGPAFTFNGEDWLVDQFNDGANQFENVVPIGATNNDVLYQTERFDNGGSFTYNIPVPAAGGYAIRLHFAEIFHGVENTNGIGARVFDVDVETGQGLLSNYDIIAQVGAPATAIIAGFNNINVTDGFFTISFNGTVDNPKISGIELFAISTAPLPPTVVDPGDHIYNQGELVNIQINGQDPNIGDLLTYSATGLPAGLSMDSASGLISGTLSDPAGDYVVTVLVTDDGGLFVEQTFTITIGDFISVFRINSGGPAFIFNGEDWLVDQFNDAGQSFTNAIPIAATNNDVLYQTEVFDNSSSFTYNIPVPAAGGYAIRLHFAEIFHGVNNTNGVGARVFDVDVEAGQGVLSNYDIIAQVGAPATAIIASFNNINVTDGFFTITFNGTVDNPKLSGLELFSVATPPAPPIVVNPGNQINNLGESIIIQINANDPNVGDVITYSAFGLPNTVTIDPVSGLITGTLSDPAGVYGVTVRATDNGGLFSEETFNITIGNFIPLFRINSGGPAFTFNGEDWLVDQFNDGANQFENVIPISATNNDVLYQTERFDDGGSFTYNIPVPAAGDYAIELHFAEIFFGVNTVGGVGSRVFNVNVENGQGQLSNYDIIAQVGAPATAIIVCFNNITVTDGFFTIDFNGVVDNPKLSGLELFEIGDLPPVLDAIGDQTVAEGALLDIPISATDNSGPPAITGTDIPTFATLTDNGDGTAMLSLAPGFVDNGIYTVTITATDIDGLTDEETFNITVTDENGPPVLAAIGDQVVAEGDILDVSIAASDPDGEIPVLTAAGLQPFMSFVDNTDGTGQLLISPGFTDVGVYNVTITATDGMGLQDEETLQVTVTDVNAPPELVPSGDQVVSEGNTLDVPVSASDPDNEIPVISATGLPSFASLVDNNNGTATLSLSPGFMDNGIYTVTITATDAAGLTDEETITVTVLDVNAAPELAFIGDQTVPEGDVLDLLITASDPDGEIPVLTATGLSPFMSFMDNGDGTGQLLISPGFTDVGLYSVTITAADAIGLQDEETILVTITEVNAAPILVNIPDQTLEEGSSLQFDIVATDPDNEIPGLTASGLQPFMDFIDNGDGTGMIIVTPDFNDFGMFTITVSATDAAGLFDEQEVVIDVTEITRDPEWSIDGQIENANCLNEAGAITLTVSGGFGVVEYLWSDGETTKDISSLTSGVYTVTITDQKDNSTEESFTVNTQPGPQKPTLTLDDRILMSTPAESYQWSLDGVEIEGAISQIIEVTLSGEYSVAIADELGCSVMSDPFIVTFDFSELNVYPVPSDGALNIEIILKENEVITLVLIDAMGRQTPLGTFDLAAGRHTLNLNFNDALANGVYFLMNNGSSFESNITRVVLIR